MKTKVNEVPLVGPRGRKELLKKVNELEKKAAEPASNPSETHILEILDFGDFDGEQVFLSNLLLDGYPTTLEELRSLVGKTLFLKYTNEHMILVTYQRVQSELFEFYGCVPIFDDTPGIDVVRVVWEGGDYGYIENTGAL